MRQIFICINSAGSQKEDDDRIVEIGAIELKDRELTINYFHCYINPKKNVAEDAIAKHGITNEFLDGKPLFHEIAEELAR